MSLFLQLSEKQFVYSVCFSCIPADMVYWLNPYFNRFLSDFCPQDDSIQIAVMPCCQQTSIPLLMACTTNVKTVVANPIVYLTNLTHDILQTINALDSPPHPDIVNNEVKQSLVSFLFLVLFIA